MKNLIGTLKKTAVLSLVLGFLPLSAQAATTYGPEASASVVAPQIVQQASSQSTSLLAGRISQAVSSAVGSGFGGGLGSPQTAIIGGDGKAAGDSAKDTAMWLNIGNSWIENDQSGVDYSGQILTGLIGVDHQFNDQFLAGVAFGYENPDIDTKFNNGTFEGNNFTVSPYASYIFNKNFYVNGNVGYAVVDYDTSRNDGAITGDISGDRFFGDLSANSRFELGGWDLRSTFGYMYLVETQDAYTESGAGGNRIEEEKIHFGQWRLSGQAGYEFETQWGSIMPFGSVQLEYDSIKPDAGVADQFGTPVANDKFGATFGLGAQANIGDDLSLTVEGTTAQFREHLDVYSLTGTLRFKF